MLENLSNSKQNIDIKRNNISELIFIIIFSIITGVLWQFEIGRYILYPFTIMGTWFHEMSHGITAMLLGANFDKLELFSNGSGVATYTGGVILGRVGNALVAAAGPLGPAIFGSMFIISTKNPKLTRIFLYILALLLLISIIFWIRTTFGVIFALIFGIGIFLAAKKLGLRGQRLLLQFLGVQAIMSLYLSIGYMFSSGASIGGENYYSDTQVIQNSLFLPYWIWGLILLIISILLLILSLYSVYKSNNS